MVEDLERVEWHLHRIYDKIPDLENKVQNMCTTIERNCLINGENPKNKEIDIIKNEINDLKNRFRKDFFPCISDLIEEEIAKEEEEEDDDD